MRDVTVIVLFFFFLSSKFVLGRGDAGLTSFLSLEMA